MRCHLNLKVGLFLFTTLVPMAALAVPITPIVPPVAEPGRVGQKFRIEDDRPDVGGQSIITLPDDHGRDKPIKEGTNFTLKGIDIENSTVFSHDELEQDYNGLVGKSVTLGSLNDVAAKITARYRNAGYILSRAVIPPQRIANGVVKIRIVEGFVNKVVFEGKSASSALLAAYGEKIRTAKPLNTAVLERYLLLMEDLPGVRVEAVLRPSSSTSGASDVVVTLIEKMFDGSVSVDNRGSRYIGPYEAGVTVNANNILGVFDRTELRGLTTAQTHEERFGQILHEEQLDSEGTKGSLAYGRTRTEPGYRLAPFDIDGTDTIYTAAVSHPFIRSRQTNLFGNAQFDVRNTDTSSLGIRLNGDRLRVLRLGGSYDFIDRFLAVNRVETQLSKGFGWDDDVTPFLRSRINGRTNFYKATAQASHLQTISGPFGFLLSTTGQVASDALLSAEQFGLGGPNFGSAYDPSELTGDSGLAGRAELQYSRTGDFQYLPSYQAYGFYDFGKVWTRNPSAGIETSDSLASAGVGVRFNALEQLSGSIELAIPLTKDVAANNFNGNGDSPRVFFSLVYRY